MGLSRGGGQGAGRRAGICRRMAHRTRFQGGSLTWQEASAPRHGTSPQDTGACSGHGRCLSPARVTQDRGECKAGAPLMTWSQKSHLVISSLFLFFHFLEQTPKSSPRASGGAFGSHRRGTIRECVPVLENCEWLHWDSSLSRHGPQAWAPSSSPPPCQDSRDTGGRSHWGK